MAARCSSCDVAKQRVADSGAGLCACDIMSWDDGLHELCSACEPTCLTCVDLSKCDSCNSTKNRILNSTTDFFNVSSLFCVCLYGYYSLALNADCLPCHYSC